MSEAKTRLATAFANIGLDKTRKQLDAIKSRPLFTLPKKNEETTKKRAVVEKTIVKKTIVKPAIAKSTIAKNTVVKPTIVEKTIVKPTIAETTIVKKTKAKAAEEPTREPTPSPTPHKEKENSTIAKKTIVEKTSVKPTIAEPAIVKTTIVPDTKTPSRTPMAFWGPEDLWDLVDQVFPHHSPNEITVYMTLLRESYGRNNSETGFISLNELSKRTGINRKSLPVTMELLQKSGLASTIETSAKQGNKYRIRGLAI